MINFKVVFCFIFLFSSLANARDVYYKYSSASINNVKMTDLDGTILIYSQAGNHFLSYGNEIRLNNSFPHFITGVTNFQTVNDKSYVRACQPLYLEIPTEKSDYGIWIFMESDSDSPEKVERHMTNIKCKIQFFER